MVVRDGFYGAPIVYRSWAEWRHGRRRPEHLWLRAIPLQCAFCWGQRKIWEPSLLGLMPVVCHACEGTGAAAA